MDPLTHALAGATIAFAATRDRRSLLIGAAAGLLPDVDIFIRSSADPLLAIEHHRGFTHSLLFAPAGALVVALPFLRSRFRVAYVAALLAYLSHELLDAATTYGTRLFWPFSRYRVGLDVISIIDPLFTLILLIAVVSRHRRIALAALALCLAWLAAGYVQRERATAVQTRLAAARGTQINRAAVFPTFGNTLVWRSIYETDGLLYIDRIRVPWLGAPTYAPVTSVPLVRADDADYHRFAWFSDGWTARAPSDPTVIGDARYSLRSDQYDPVWGIRLAPTQWVDRTRDRKVDVGALWDEIRGRDPAYRPIEAR
ncbi:MAG TPA: metal-dependent hydrolase [Thermoanaerobaculia bacterium]